MSNYPDGCTQADYDAYWGGPEPPDPETHDHYWPYFGWPCECGAEYCRTPRCQNAQPESWRGEIQSDLTGLCRECAIAKLVRELEVMLAAPPRPEALVPDDSTLQYLEIVALREWDGRELDAYLNEAA